MSEAARRRRRWSDPPSQLHSDSKSYFSSDDDDHHELYSGGSFVDEDQDLDSGSDYSAGPMSTSDDEGHASFDSSDSDGSAKARTKTKNKNKDVDLIVEICQTIREQASSGEEVMKLIKARFETTDKDKNGYIDAEEFRQLLVSILGGRQVQLEDSNALLKRFKIDVNGNGKISYDEFVSFVSLDRKAITQAADKLREILVHKLENEDEGSLAMLYGRYCNHKRNTIGKPEFKILASSVEDNIVKTMTDGELDGLMRHIDKQGKGEIDISDFQLFLEEVPDSVQQETDKMKRRNSLLSIEQKDGVDHDTNMDYVVVDLRLGLKSKKKEEEELLAQGFTRLTSNLNEKGRGSCVHLFVKRANIKSFPDEQSFKRARITDIALSRTNKDTSLLALGFQCVQPYHTNQGAWFARKHFLWFRRNPSDNFPIIDIAVTTGKSKDLSSKLWTPPFRGYKRVEGDLNAGNRGSQVFLWYFKHNFENEMGNQNNPQAELIRMIRNKLRDLTMDDDEAQNGGVDGEIDLEKVWDKFDKHDRGYLPRAKVRSMVAGQIGLDLKKRDMEKFMDILDVNHDNKIDRDEFMEFLAFNPSEVAGLVKRIRVELQNRKIVTKQELRKWFATGGGANKKRKTAKEFNKMLRSIDLKLTNTECQSLMGRFDRDGDGMIDVKEFTSYLLSKKGREEESETKKFVQVENAARKLRSYFRNLASPDMDFHAVCDNLFRNTDHLSKGHLQSILRSELNIELTPQELGMLLVRVGTTRQKVVEFISSATYLDAVLLMIVEAASKVESSRLFRQFDTDGNGRLSKEEFINGLKSLSIDDQPIHLSNAELDMLIQRFDQDGDGEVDVGEFLSFISNAQRTKQVLQRNMSSSLLDEEEKEIGDPAVLYVFTALRRLYQEKRRAEPIFNIIDTHGHGSFNNKDLQHGLERLGIVPQEVQLSLAQFDQVFRRIDLHGRHRVNLQSFQQFLSKSNKNGKSKQDRIGRLWRRNVLKGISPIAHELEAECQNIDTKGSGVIPKSEFIDIMGDHVSKRTVQNLLKNFSSKTRHGVDYESFFEWVDTLHHSDNGDDFDDEKEDEDRDDEESYFSPRSIGRSSSGGKRSPMSSPKNRKSKLVAMYAKQLRSVKPHKLEQLLGDFATGPDGKRVSRSDFNDAMKSIDVHPMSKPIWSTLFGSSDRFVDPKVVVRKLSLYSKKRSPKSSNYRGDSSDDDSYLFENNKTDDDDDAEDDVATSNARMVVQYVSKCLNKAITEHGFVWERAVRMFDADGSGTVKTKDMVRILRAAGCELPIDKLRRVASECAALREGGHRVNYEHFFSAILGDSKVHVDQVEFEQVEAKVRNAIRSNSKNFDIEAEFAKLDRNGDGKITSKELAKQLPGLLGGMELSPGELHALITKYDTNRDGRIDLEEFSNLIEFTDADLDQLVAKIKSEFRAQARHGTSYQEIFEQFDSNGDDMLSRREFRQCMEQILTDSTVQLNNREMRKLMDRLDRSGSGKIDYRAFCEMCAPSEIEMLAVETKVRDKIRSVVSRKGHSIDFKQAFKLFDADGNGRISRREFQQTCSRLGLALSEDELELLLQRFDTSGDGNVDYFEFCRFISYDGIEVENLNVRAGKHLDLLQHEQVNPVKIFENYEGRKRPVGVVARHEFHRGCKDLKMPFSDAEIAALADLYADTQDSSKVKYRDFCLSVLSAAGANFRGQMFSGGKSSFNRRSNEADEIWNPSNLSDWLDRGATESQRKKFEHLQKVMSKAMVQETTIKRKDGARRKSKHAKKNSQTSLADREIPVYCNAGTLWDCPVCFYKQIKPGRLTCEMCDSPCPSNNAAQWPHIKPLLDGAYDRIGIQYYPENGENTNGQLTNRSDMSKKKAPKWFSDPLVLEEELGSGTKYHSEEEHHHHSTSPRRKAKHHFGSRSHSRSKSRSRSPRRHDLYRSPSPRKRPLVIVHSDDDDQISPRTSGHFSPLSSKRSPRYF